MKMIDIIGKKKNGSSLTKNEIEFFINGYVNGKIPDYQVSALCMAIWFNGMNSSETADLTLCMAESGDMIDLSSIPGLKADKHSTGGVGDTTTLIIGPIVAACGGKVAKMSGRGLGHTGGTLDKLESIPGLTIDLSMETFKNNVSMSGFSVAGQTANLVPADKLLYSLRDVTGTVDNLSLIASSIMSKKLASGSDIIVLDVKTGTGAFMQEPLQAKELAEQMVDIGNKSGRRTEALVTDMNEPLGNAVGNALEVIEAIDILKGEGISDWSFVRELEEFLDEGGYHYSEKLNQFKNLSISIDLLVLSCILSAKMLVLSKVFENYKDAFVEIEKVLSTGKALDKFAEMIKLQGGNPEVTVDTRLLPEAANIIPVKAERAGYISGINTCELGMSALLLGAGRTKKTDKIDPAVGFWMKKRIGDYTEKSEEIAGFHVNNKIYFNEAVSRFQNAVTITDKKPEDKKLIYYSIK